MYSNKYPFTLVLLLVATSLYAAEEAAQSEMAELATSTEPVEVATKVAVAAPTIC